MTEIGHSAEERPIYSVQIHDQRVNHNVTIVIVFGSHSREWASQNSAVFLIRHLLNNTKLHRHIMTTKWYIVPVLNPDGYHFSTTKSSLWRKNRRLLANSKCVGVDLDRNFPAGWKSASSKKGWCEQDFSGPSTLSENEAQILKVFLEKISYTDAYVDVHSCSQAILMPFNYQKVDIPKDSLKSMTDAANQMKAAMEKTRGTKYAVKAGSDLRVVGGTSLDFAFQDLDIPITFMLELGYVNKGETREDLLNCFHPSDENLVFLEKECLQGLLALNQYLVSKHQPRQKSPDDFDIKNQGSTKSTLYAVSLSSALFQMSLLVRNKCWQ
ncbi:hypothetical protein GE061_010565 [Apolygus lucorum]|uniref:Peptidase M14 domain-containing protein n=1 Tax=Apolygus lucorum TaxID=248454 RepID=A0A8S9XZ13_APOLU|nr:hypothetical protein GE061_010565 [Apolygus lucorum]